jgi:hypothetical protein
LNQPDDDQPTLASDLLGIALGLLVALIAVVAMATFFPHL